MTSPVVLVLDDVHVLHNRECRAALSALADHVPEGSRLVLAGRAEPPLRIPRLLAEGRLLEIGPVQLSLTREEASALLANFPFHTNRGMRELARLAFSGVIRSAAGGRLGSDGDRCGQTGDDQRRTVRLCC